jgi:hypothetical protein
MPHTKYKDPSHTQQLYLRLFTPKSQSTTPATTAIMARWVSLLLWTTWLTTAVVCTTLIGLAPALEPESVASAKPFVWALMGGIRAVSTLRTLRYRPLTIHTERPKLRYAWPHRLRWQQEQLSPLIAGILGQTQQEQHLGSRWSISKLPLRRLRGSHPEPRPERPR